MSKLKYYQNIGDTKLFHYSGQTPTLYTGLDYNNVIGSTIAPGKIAINLVDNKLFYAHNNGITEIDGDIIGTTTKKIDVTGSTYTLNESINYPEVLLHVTTASTITIDTDQLSNDSDITIKVTGDFEVTVETEGSETIDGETTQTATGYEAMKLYNHNSQWWIK